MTTFRFSRFTSAVASIFLKTPLDCLHFVPLFSKLFAFANLGFFFLGFFSTIVKGCFWWFLISLLGWSLSSRFCDWYVSSSSSSFRVRRLVRFLVGVLHFLQLPSFFFLLSLHISMGSDRFPVLRIGSDPAKVSGSGRMGW